MIRYVTHGTRGFAPTGGRPVKVALYAPGRTCAEEHCATILSTYNPADYCALHEHLHPPAMPQRHQHAELPLVELACPRCGHVFETNNPRRRYCSDACRAASFQVRRMGAEGRLRDN